MSDFNSNLIEQIRAGGGHLNDGPFAGRQVLILTTTGAKSRRDARGSPRLQPGWRRHRDHRLDGRGAKPSVLVPQHRRQPAGHDRGGRRQVRGGRPDRRGRRAPSPVRPARRAPRQLHRVRGEDGRSGHPGHRPAGAWRQRPPPDATLRGWQTTRSWSGGRARPSSPTSRRCTPPTERPGTRPPSAMRAGSTRRSS